MILNEVFDEDIPDDEFTEIVVTAASKPVQEPPKGDFVRVLGGREVWFRTPSPGQFHAWQRYQKALNSQFSKVKKRAKEDPSLETLSILSDLSGKYDMAVIEFVESLMVDEDDKDFVALQMINGSVRTEDLMRVLFVDPEDDDVEPAPKPVKPPKKSAANAKRTKR